MGNKVFESAPLVRLTVCMMVGIVVGSRVEMIGAFNLGMAATWLWPVLAGSVVLALLLWRYALLQSVAIAVCFILLGWLLAARQQASSRVLWPEGEVRYEAVVVSEPQEKPKTMAVDVMLVPGGQRLKCYLYKDERSRRLRIGDGLRIQSRVRAQDDWRRETTFVSSWKWKKIRLSLDGLSRMERTRLYFLSLRARLLRRLGGQGLCGEQYAVVAAMTLGDKSALTKDLRETYAVTGASHVLALSGLHLGIIYAVLSLLLVSRRWPALSQVPVILTIWAFVFLVGMSASVVRAAVMLTLYALLSLGRRDKMSVNTLAFTAMVMLMVHPLSLFDIGFQMSFAAVFSILLFMPLFNGAFPHGFMMSHRVVRWIWGMVAVSCAAQIGVAPLIAYYFGRFSTYFLLTNVIVVPAATLILYLSLVVMAVPFLTFLLAGTVAVLNASLTWIASLPYASIEGLSPSILQVVMLYVIIAAVYLLLTRLHVAQPA